MKKLSFSEIAEVVTGSTPSTKIKENYGGKIPFVSPSELDVNTPILRTEIMLSKLGGSKARLLPPETVMVCCIGATIGKVGYAGAELATNQQINSLIVDKSIAYPRYVYHYCKTIKPLLKHSSSSTTLPIVNKSRFSQFKIPLPPLEHQQQIARVLDKADELRTKRRTAIQKLDDLLQSVFLDMFGDPVMNPKGWRILPLNDVCETKGQYGSGASAIDFKYGKPRYIRITDIDDNGKLSSNKVSPSTDSVDWEKYKLIEGDVLFARSGATVGKTYLYNENHGFCVYAGYLIKFQPKSEIMRSEFLFNFTKTIFYKLWVNNKQKVVAQPNINAKQYGEELLLPVPPIEEQDKFVAISQKLQVQRTQLEAHLIMQDRLFYSLQQRAFRGELTPQTLDKLDKLETKPTQPSLF